MFVVLHLGSQSFAFGLFCCWCVFEVSSQMGDIPLPPLAVKRVGGGSNAEIGYIVPVKTVMASLAPGQCEIGYFVMFVAGLTKD